MTQAKAPSKTQINRDMNALEKLLASRGWGILKEQMEREIRQATRALTRPANLPDAEVHYRRGLIEAAYLLLDMPENFLQQLNVQLLLHKDDEKPDP